MPALSHFWMMCRTRLSAIRCSRNFISQPRSRLVKKVRQVGVEHPVHLSLFDPDRERVQRVMWSAPWPKPVGEAEEVHLVDAVQHLDEGALDDLVLQARDA